MDPPRFVVGRNVFRSSSHSFRSMIAADVFLGGQHRKGTPGVGRRRKATGISFGCPGCRSSKPMGGCLPCLVRANPWRDYDRPQDNCMGNKTSFCRGPDCDSGDTRPSAPWQLDCPSGAGHRHSPGNRLPRFVHGQLALALRKPVRWGDGQLHFASRRPGEGHVPGHPPRVDRSKRPELRQGDRDSGWRDFSYRGSVQQHEP